MFLLMRVSVSCGSEFILLFTYKVGIPFCFLYIEIAFWS